VQFADPTFAAGSNEPSPEQAWKNFLAIGAHTGGTEATRARLVRTRSRSSAKARLMAGLRCAPERPAER
jgi:hypothetical protein